MPVATRLYRCLGLPKMAVTVSLILVIQNFRSADVKLLILALGVGLCCNWGFEHRFILFKSVLGQALMISFAEILIGRKAYYYCFGA